MVLGGLCELLLRSCQYLQAACQPLQAFVPQMHCSACLCSDLDHQLVVRNPNLLKKGSRMAKCSWPPHKAECDCLSLGPPLGSVGGCRPSLPFLGSTSELPIQESRLGEPASYPWRVPNRPLRWSLVREGDAGLQPGA